MPATVTSIAPKPTPTGVGRAPRRPFRDNPRLILAGIIVLLAALAALVAIASRTSRFSPDFLSEFVLYALSAADVTMLAALVFVLARNIVKLIIEQRRALPFARFRAKLVAVLLGMTLIPAVLVLLVGSELIRTSIDLVEVYRIGSRPGEPPRVVPVVDVAAETLPREYSRASADRLAGRTAVGTTEPVVEQLSGGGELIRVALPIRSSPNGPVRGVVI